MQSAAREKSYEFSYVLNRGKLSRILEILEEHGAAESKTPEGDEVLLSGGKVKYSFSAPRIYEQSIVVHFAQGLSRTGHSGTELFALDNTARNPIQGLRIHAEKAGSFEARLHFDSTKLRSLTLEVWSATPQLADTLFASLDEQIERTEERALGARLKAIAWGHGMSFLVAPLMAIAVFLTMIQVADNAGVAKLKLLEQARSASTDSERIAFLFERERQALEQSLSTESTSLSIQLPSRRALAIFLPALILLGLVWYLLSRCYPKAVFAWGDMEAVHEALVSKRRNIWTGVILAFFVSIVASIFVLGLSGA